MVFFENNLNVRLFTLSLGHVGKWKNAGKRSLYLLSSSKLKYVMYFIFIYSN